MIADFMVTSGDEYIALHHITEVSSAQTMGGTTVTTVRMVDGKVHAFKNVSPRGLVARVIKALNGDEYELEDDFYPHEDDPDLT